MVHEVVDKSKYMGFLKLDRLLVKVVKDKKYTESCLDKSVPPPRS